MPFLAQAAKANHGSTGLQYADIDPTTDLLGYWDLRGCNMLATDEGDPPGPRAAGARSAVRMAPAPALTCGPSATALLLLGKGYLTFLDTSLPKTVMAPEGMASAGAFPLGLEQWRPH